MRLDNQERAAADLRVTPPYRKIGYLAAFLVLDLVMLANVELPSKHPKTLAQALEVALRVVGAPHDGPGYFTVALVAAVAAVVARPLNLAIIRLLAARRLRQGLDPEGYSFGFPAKVSVVLTFGLMMLVVALVAALSEVCHRLGFGS